MMRLPSFLLLFVIIGMELSRGHHVSSTLFVRSTLFPIVDFQHHFYTNVIDFRSVVDLANRIAFLPKMNSFDQIDIRVDYYM